MVDLVSETATAQQWGEWLQTPLQYAAAAGNQEATRNLLSAGARGNALFVAIRGGHEEIVDDLLWAGRLPTEKEEKTGDIPLHVASTLGHSRIVRSLLREGAKKDELNSEGFTALHLAAQQGWLPVVKVLFAANVNVDLASTNDRSTALMLACRRGHVKIVRTLIKHGATLDLWCADNHTAVHHAAIANQEECLAVLLEAGADVDPPATFPWFYTPLHMAAENGSAEAVCTLLGHGAAKNANDRGLRGNTPLHMAIRAEHMHVVKKLLSAGADIDALNAEGGTPVSAAAASASAEILRLLVQRGANVNAAPSMTRGTALHTAARCNRVGAIDVLIEAGADTEMLHDGRTPLHEAVRYSSCQAVVALLRHGCDKDERDEMGHTPLLSAIRTGSCTVVTALLTAGADVTPRFGVEQHSALDWATVSNRMSIAETLVDHGADVNATTSAGLTALHKASYTMPLNVLSTLVQMGARLNAKDEHGVTPLMTVTALGGCPSLVGDLVELGADVNAQDANGNSLLHYAVSICDLTLVSYHVEVLLGSNADERALNVNGLTPAALLEEKNAFPGVLPDEVDSEYYWRWGEDIGLVREMFAAAPARRKERVWRRRRLLVMWRAYPDRYQPARESRERLAGRTQPGAVRGRAERGTVDAAGSVGRHGSISSAVSKMLARVVGLEEDDIFRSIVTLL